MMLAVAAGLAQRLSRSRSPFRAPPSPRTKPRRPEAATRSLRSKRKTGVRRPFGTFDNAQLQRGFQVYKEVCSNCHSMRLSPTAISASRAVRNSRRRRSRRSRARCRSTDGPNDKGEMFSARGGRRTISARPSPTRAARAANGGALPPGSLGDGQGAPGGPDYIYALLTGYADAPAGFDLAQGMHYNKAFPGHQIAMPPPLSDGVVAYTDGTSRRRSTITRATCRPI